MEYLGIHEKYNNVGHWKKMKENCAKVCKNKKSPEGKEAKGFIVKRKDGRCFCEIVKSENNCEGKGKITKNSDYIRFDFDKPDESLAICLNSRGTQLGLYSSYKCEEKCLGCDKNREPKCPEGTFWTRL